MKEEKKRQIRKKDKSSGVGLTCIQSCHVYIKSILSRLNVSYSVPELSFQDFDHSKDPTSGSQLAFPLKPPATLKLEENLICSQWNSPGSCLFFRDVIKSLEPSTVNWRRRRKRKKTGERGSKSGKRILLTDIRFRNIKLRDYIKPSCSVDHLDWPLNRGSPHPHTTLVQS